MRKTSKIRKSANFVHKSCTFSISVMCPVRLEFLSKISCGKFSGKGISINFLADV